MEQVTREKNIRFMESITTPSFLFDQELTCAQLYGDDRCAINFCECLRGIDEEWDEDLREFAKEMCAEHAQACEDCGVFAEHCRSPVREW